MYTEPAKSRRRCHGPTGFEPRFRWSWVRISLVSMRLKRQRGMAGMIRSSRRSTKQSSIIRQNGDIIIVKGGKIVSIRRQAGWPGGLQDSSPFIPRAATAQKNALENGHCHGIKGAAAHNNNLVLVSNVGSQSKASISSEGSDNVFDDSLSNIVPTGDVSPDSHLEMISEEKRLLSQNSECERVREESVDANGVWTRSSDVGVYSEDAGMNNEDTDPQDSLTESRRHHRTDVGIIISIDEDNSILDVMPLTPYTRDRIARSDFFLDSDADNSLPPLKPSKISKSSQGLQTNPPVHAPNSTGGRMHKGAKDMSSKRSMHRMLSVEYLDPPVSLTRSRSAQNVQKVSGATGSHGGRPGLLNLPPPPTERRWSFGRLMHKKPEHPVRL